MSPTRKIFLLVALPLLVVFVSIVAYSLRNNDAATSQETDIKENDTSTTAGTDKPILQNLGGVTLAAYNSSTGLAGDIKFSKDGIDAARGQESIFYMFGQKLPKNSATDPQRINPNFEFKGIAKQIDIIAALDGIVVDIKQQSGSNDYELFLIPSEDSPWVIGYDHLVNLAVKKGDTVKAGQKLGLIAPENSGGYRYELQINNNDEDAMYCPLELLDQDVQSTIGGQITQLATDWVSWYGKDVYGTHVGGCVKSTLTAAESEGR